MKRLSTTFTTWNMKDCEFEKNLHSCWSYLTEHCRKYGRCLLFRVKVSNILLLMNEMFVKLRQIWESQPRSQLTNKMMLNMKRRLFLNKIVCFSLRALLVTFQRNWKPKLFFIMVSTGYALFSLLHIFDIPLVI